MNLDVNAFQKSFSPADFSSDLSHFSTADVPHYSNSKPTKSHKEAFEESSPEKELRWGSKKPRTPRKPKLMSEQELDSIFDDFQLSDDFPLPDDFQMPDDFEFNELLGTVHFDESPSQEKVTEKVRVSEWKSRYTKLKEDPIKYEAYLAKKRRESKKKFELKQEMKRKQSVGDANTEPMDPKKLMRREKYRKYHEKFKKNPEARRQYLDRRKASRKMRLEKQKAIKASLSLGKQEALKASLSLFQYTPI